MVAGVKGTSIEVALPPSARLQTDDILLLDDGSLVEVVAQPEPLFEVRAADLPALARIAWHLGDRHVPVQVLPNRIRLRRDPDLRALLERLGAKVTPITAPFDPEGGAYEARHAHGHDHGHHHDHDHDHARGHDHHHHHHDHHHHDHD
jgi:urease accessory protein